MPECDTHSQAIESTPRAPKIAPEQRSAPASPRRRTAPRVCSRSANALGFQAMSAALVRVETLA